MKPPNDILTSSRVAISAEHGEYAATPPYSPAADYPEYPFGAAALSEAVNPAYEGLRDALRLLGMDRQRYGQESWNPLSELVQPGDTVVLKPSFVRDFRETQPGHGDCLMTHGSVIRAVLDYVYIALAGRGRIIIADAPQNDADFDAIRRIAALDEIQAFYARHAGFEVEVYDLRPELARKIDGVIVGHVTLPGDPAGYVKVNLGLESAFTEVNHLCHLLYGSEYETSDVRNHHHDDVHEYLVSKTILGADCVISLPKAKTHKKTGITVNMKNLVGINGNKNWLPHHREGTPARGGDQFADDRARWRIEQKVVSCFKRLFPTLGPLRRVVAGPIKAVGKRVFGDTDTGTIRSGNWYGNDTTWRMVIDLNRIFLYADAAGNLHHQPARRVFTVVDGIIAGEGRGPLDASPRRAGVVLAGSNLLAVDVACARLMGFDYRKLPLLARALEDHAHPIATIKPQQITCLSNRPSYDGPVCEIAPLSPPLAPHPAWRGHVELSEPATIAAAEEDEWVIELDHEGPAPTGKSAAVLFLGDVAIAGRVGDAVDRHGTDFPFQRLPRDFFDAEVVCFNLECCLSRRGEPWEPKPVTLRGAPEHLDIFPAREQQYVANVANNHFLDYGEVAAADTLAALRAKGMHHFGAAGEGADLQPLILPTGGGRLGLLGFAPSAHPLPAGSKVNVAWGQARDLVEQVARARPKADVLVVSLHQGIECSPYVDAQSRRLSRRLIDAGADCVICHHTHVLQAIERHRAGVVFHGIGNFLIDIDIDPSWRPHAAFTLALRAELAGGRIRRIAVEPVRIGDTLQPQRVIGPERDDLRAHVNALSQLLESRFGAFRNNLGARRRWARDKISAAAEMVRRGGVAASVAYYGKRVVAKLRASASRPPAGRRTEG